MGFVLNVDADRKSRDDDEYYVTIHDGSKSCDHGDPEPNDKRYWVRESMPNLCAAWKRAEAELFKHRPIWMRIRECGICKPGKACAQ